MLVVLPIFIPLLTAGICLLLGRRPRVQRPMAVSGAGALLVSALVLCGRAMHVDWQVVHIGGWPAPLGIALVADRFAALMVLVAALMHLTATLYSFANISARQQRYGYFVFLNVMQAGVCGAFLTGDLFNLYVWFEVLLIASFVLLVLGGGRAQMEAGIKYVTLSLLSSALFLAGVGIVYGIAHTLNMAQLALRLDSVSLTHPWLIVAAALPFLISFGIKAAVFPLHFWLPASYHTPSPVVSAIFAGLLTKVGVYALIRVFVVVIPPSQYVHTLLVIVAGLTMLLGVLGAVAQSQIRRVLSFHIVSQIGYMVMGLALLIAPDPATRQLGIAAAIFYIAHHILVKTNLFFVGGIVRRLDGTEQLDQLGDRAKRSPWLALLFIIPAFSLAGVPPLSGFWAKLLVIRAGFLAGQYTLTAIALLAGLLTLVSMLKIWNEVFWKPRPACHDAKSAPPTYRGARSGHLRWMVAPAVVLALLTTLIGFYPQTLLTWSQRAAEQLFDRAGYVAAVGVATDLERPQQSAGTSADAAAVDRREAREETNTDTAAARPNAAANAPRSPSAFPINGGSS